MYRITILTLVLCCTFSLFNFTHASKVSPEVQQELDKGNRPNVIVECPKSQSIETSQSYDNILKEISEKNRIAATARTDRVTDLVGQLYQTVLDFLTPVLDLLDNMNVPHEILLISSEIYIPKITEKVVKLLVKIDIVTVIRVEQTFPRIPPQPPGTQPAPEGNKTWNIGLINARCKDIKENYGRGVIVAVLDNGVRETHKEIKDNWLGKKTKFGYFDGYLQDCKPFPGDHGTMSVSLLVGKNVGVAYEANWMMCRMCDDASCAEASIKLCMQWASCPYECGDTSREKNTKNCKYTPHVINNSWGSTENATTSEEYYVFYEYVQYWNNLGIISIFAGGNKGQGCMTMGYPGSYDISLAVGAVDSDVVLGYFSSVGPQVATKPLTSASISVGTCSSTGCGSKKPVCSLIKPDIVAPGVMVEGAWSTSDTEIQAHSGTSFAAPQVSGVVALMISAKPEAKWDYKVAYKILTDTVDTSRIDLLGERQAKDKPQAIRTNLLCNYVVSDICNTYPNNMYGYGLVNACKAVKVARNLKQ